MSKSELLTYIFSGNKIGGDLLEFITSGDRIAVENFSIGKIYTITWETGTYKNLACVGTGSDFVMFQDQSPELLFCLTMESAQAVSSIEEGSSGGTTNYNELDNKPSINGFVLVGNKTGADLGLVSQSDLDNYVTDSELATELEDYATNASVVAALASKQDALSSEQLAAVNSGITSALVNQIGTNTSAIAGKQDALSSSQLAAVNSGITSADVAQITTNKNSILSITPATIVTATNTAITITGIDNTNNTNCLLLCSDRRDNDRAEDALYMINRYQSYIRISKVYGTAATPTVSMTDNVITVSGLKSYLSITALSARSLILNNVTDQKEILK